MIKRIKYLSFVALAISLAACGTTGSRMSDDHRQALINQISSGHGFDQISYCSDFLRSRGKTRSGSFPRSPQLVPGTIELGSFEQSKEQTYLGDTEIIQASYSARYDLTCLEQDPASIGTFPRSLEVPVEICIQGFASLYKAAGMQGYELAQRDINNIRPCDG